MKKLFSAFLATVLAFSLAACGEAPSSGAASGSETPAPSSGPASAPLAPSGSSEADTSSPQPEAGEQKGKTLVAYFSWSGNTRQMAEAIARQTGAGLFEIAPATPYTQDYDELLDVARQEQGDGARPALSTQVENWDSYDTVFLGYPNWWSDAPMAVYTFLESYDFSGKALVPFSTSASGGFGRSLSGIEDSAAGAEVLEGLALTEGELEDMSDRVTAWLDGLGLNG